MAQQPFLAPLMLESEAADYLRLTNEQLAKIRRRGDIAFIKFSGHKVRYTKQILDDYVSQCQQNVIDRSYAVSGTIGSRRDRTRNPGACPIRL